MTVAALLKQDEATTDDAKKWVKAMAERGKWSSAAARKRLVALSALESVLGPEDSRTAKSMLENAETLCRDWCRKNNADGATAAAYGASVRGTLTIYLAYLEDPAKAQAQFEATASKPRKLRPKSSETEGSTATPAPAPTTATTTSEATVATPRAQLRSYPLGDCREVQFTFPENFTVRDLAKFTCHAATFCADFDPNRPTRGTVVSIARVDEAEKGENATMP